jgi:type I restriction enzyme, R subunit
LEFVLSKYIESGVEELDQEKLSALLELKCQSMLDASDILGCVEKIRKTFIDFQKHLYGASVA